MIHYKSILAEAESIQADLIEIRRHLHRHPELSFQEKATSDFVRSQLDKLSIPYTTGWAGHGIVATIKGGGNSNKIIALRADMDALPIHEVDGRSYGSQNPGVMHACGHDVHTTCLLGAARLLQSYKDQFHGTVKLIFQPGEEKLPGGASIMIKEGLFEVDKPAAIFGLHVHPPMEVGKVGVKAGIYMASADEIYITVEGKGGHAALPQDCIDPISLSADLINSFQKVVSRMADPTIPMVLTIGKIHSDGGTTNVIPDRVLMEGTLRTMDEGLRKKAHETIRNICKGLEITSGAKIDLDIRLGYPCLINDTELVDQFKEVASEVIGGGNVEDLPIRMTAEDFSYYSHHVPACFFRLGTGNKKKGITRPVHTKDFDVDERCLSIGAATMTAAAIKALSY